VSASECESIDYLPFGETTTSGSCDTTYRFTGYKLDSESSLDYAGARSYAFSNGRFMSPDPANAGADPSNPQSWNMYSYVMNNPLNAIDPTGMNCVWDNGSYDAEDDPWDGNTAQGQTNCEKAGGVWDANVTGDWNPNPDSALQEVYSESTETSPSSYVFGGPNAAQQEMWEAVNQFLSNGPKPTIVYQPDDPFTQEFQKSMAMQGIMSRIASSCSKSGSESVGTFEAFANTMMDGFGGYPGGNGQGVGFQTPEAQIGAFNFTYSRNSAITNITVTNPISLNSAALHMTSPLGIKNPTSGHFGTVNQEVHMIAANPCGS
jgi:RHS repeat-associated protein